MDERSVALLRLLKEKIASGPDDQVITTPEGGQLRIRRNPEPGVSLMVEPVGAAPGIGSISWDPSAARPTRYPADLPFLPGRAAMVSTMPGSVNVQWPQVAGEDPATVAAALLADGWTETTMPTPTMPGMSIRPFLRGERQRILVAGGEHLSLVDTPAR